MLHLHNVHNIMMYCKLHPLTCQLVRESISSTRPATVAAATAPLCPTGPRSIVSPSPATATGCRTSTAAADDGQGFQQLMQAQIFRLKGVRNTGYGAAATRCSNLRLRLP
jgi:hypothetical protein